MVKSGSARGIAVGVVGPHDIVEHIVQVGSRIARGPWRLRLESLGYDAENDVADLPPAKLSGLDALLFTGPLPHDIASQAGLLHVPTAILPISGSALYATLLRAVLESDVDITRVSIDSLTRGDVVDAYDDLSADHRRVRVMPYEDPESVEQFFDFHQRLYARGTCHHALTTVRSVAERLRAAGVPVLRMLPTSATIRSGLTHAVLLGLGSQLEGAQTALCIVEIMPPRTGDSSATEYWLEDLRLAAHRLLLEESRPMGAKIIVRDPRTFEVATTLGPLVEATRDFTVQPFVRRLHSELGVEARLGIGLGHTVQDAERNALDALADSTDAPDGQPSVIGPYGQTRVFKARHEGADKQQDIQPRLHDTYEQLLTVLEYANSGASPTPMVVDAEQAATALDVTPRTARRILQSMADAGLVWPLPRQQNQGRGRPRQRFRLVSTASEPHHTAN